MKGLVDLISFLFIGLAHVVLLVWRSGLGVILQPFFRDAVRRRRSTSMENAVNAVLVRSVMICIRVLALTLTMPSLWCKKEFGRSISDLRHPFSFGWTHQGHPARTTGKCGLEVEGQV
jgi:hypothetical protein